VVAKEAKAMSTKIWFFFWWKVLEFLGGKAEEPSTYVIRMLSFQEHRTCHVELGVFEVNLWQYCEGVKNESEQKRGFYINEEPGAERHIIAAEVFWPRCFVLENRRDPDMLT
jgi:hypothetical protein